MTDKQTDNLETTLSSDENTTLSNETASEAKTETVVVKKGGSGLALLAILIALGLGGAGYYFGQQEVNNIQQKLTALEQGSSTGTAATANFEQERSQISQLVSANQNTQNQFTQLENVLNEKNQQLANLQTQVDNLSKNLKADQPNDWLLSEADFLLTNALRKLVLDNDVDTSISLLKVADEVLEKVPDARVKDVRTAINGDLKQLLSVNNVDQNAIMQRLSQLANNVDELTVLNVNFGDENRADDKVSDDVTDWKTNMEKSATSFLNHFIRISPRAENTTQALLAPNQDIYLRENIRLRLQIAILAVPRQQNELYKQSLETVAAWVRSYFDTNTEVATNFLKSVDELAEQSIYVELPTQLNSLNVLDKLLNKQTTEVQKIAISADKTLTESNQVASEEIKANEQPAENKPEEKTNAPESAPTAEPQQ